MFGYVTVDRDSLSKDEQMRFRRVYCGVCSCMSGLKGRFTLTYDSAFLALLLNALYEPKEERVIKRCGVHPIKKAELETGEMTRYAADINVILFYYSMLDGWSDEKSVTKKLASGALKKNLDEACQRIPEKSRVIQEELKNLAQLEKDRSQDIDSAAGCFGRLLGCIFAYKKDEWAGLLYRMGDALGRFIYICDAWDDLDSDIKSGAYNPLISISKEKDYQNRVYDMLRLEMAACADAFEKLPIVNDIGILRNVIYSGVWSKYSAKQKKKDEVAD